MTPTHRFVALTVILLSVFASILPGQNLIELDDAAALERLPRAEQVEFIQKALRNRLERHRNIKFTAITRLTTHEFIDGRLGKAIWHEGTVFKFHILGGSYRLDAQIYSGRIPASVDDSNWKVKSTSSYNEDDGMAVGFGRQPDDKRPGGLIADERDDTVQIGPISFLFDLRMPRYWYGEEDRSLIQGLLHRASDWNVHVDIQAQTATVSYQCPNHFGELSGPKHIAATLDCRKGLMPIVVTCEYGDIDKHEISRRESHRLTDPVSINGFWVPTRVETTYRTSGVPRRIAVERSEIKDISVGVVVPDDLTVTFPAGTLVRDLINDVSYKVGADGQQVGEARPLYHPTPPQGELPPRQLINVRFTIACLILLASILVAKRVWQSIREGN